MGGASKGPLHEPGRAALEQLRELAAGAGISIAPIVAAESLELVIIRLPPHVDDESTMRIGRLWSEGVKGTALEGVKTMVVSSDAHVLLARHGLFTAEQLRALEAEAGRR